MLCIQLNMPVGRNRRLPKDRRCCCAAVKPLASRASHPSFMEKVQIRMYGAKGASR
jgi:hypothetical protein